MKGKTIAYLFAHVLVGLCGFFTMLYGFGELIDSGFVENAQLPGHIAVVILISGFTCFVVTFMHGVDHRTWERLEGK